LPLFALAGVALSAAEEGVTAPSPSVARATHPKAPRRRTTGITKLLPMRRRREDSSKIIGRVATSQAGGLGVFFTVGSDRWWPDQGILSSAAGLPRDSTVFPGCLI